MHKSSEYQTLFTTLFAKTLYKEMSFRLCNAPAVFHRYIAIALHGQFGIDCHEYLEDVLISSIGPEEQDEKKSRNSKIGKW
jgi:hypothetical protein